MWQELPCTLRGQGAVRWKSRCFLFASVLLCDCIMHFTRSCPKTMGSCPKTVASCCLAIVFLSWGEPLSVAKYASHEILDCMPHTGTSRGFMASGEGNVCFWPLDSWALLSTIAPWAVVGGGGILFTGRTCGRALGPAWPCDFPMEGEAEGFMGAPAWQGECAGST